MRTIDSDLAFVHSRSVHALEPWQALVAHLGPNSQPGLLLLSGPEVMVDGHAVPKFGR